MTTGYLTLTQMINAKLINDKSQIDSSRLQDLIRAHLASTETKNAKTGREYYECEHDILDHKNVYYVDNVAKEDTLKANNKIPHPFHKLLVDQKVSYIAGNPVVVSVAEPEVVDLKQPTPAEQKLLDAGDEFESLLHDYLDNEFDDTLNDWIVGSSNSGTDWLHFYIAPSGELEYVVCPYEQIYPVWDSQYQEDLLYVIRFYTYETIDAQGQRVELYKAEWWSKAGVTYWMEIERDKFVLDTSYEYSEASHWYSFSTASPNVKEPHSWGVVPFVPLFNNSEGSTDLTPIKPLIDAYDKVASGWCNDLEDFQELIYVLKGYMGMKSEQDKELSDLAVFIKNLKTYKVVPLDEQGALDTVKAEIPVEAKERFLAITRKAIFYFGRGVDVDKENFDTASGVALKFLYSGLELKANQMIRKLKTALSEAMYFVCQYLNSTNGTAYNPSEIIFTFNKSQIFNEKEKTDELNADTMLSTKTKLEHHPLVDDVEEELARLEAEQSERDAKGIVDLGTIDPNAEETPVESNAPVQPVDKNLVDANAA